MLTRLVFPVRGADLSGVAALIDRERERLGRMTTGERRFAVIFALTGLA